MGFDYAQLSWHVTGALAFRFSYNSGMVADLKATIPSSERRWDPTAKVWLVLPQHAQACGALAQQHLGLAMAMPFGGAPQILADTRALDVRYIGATKDRGNNTRSAFGWFGGEWSVVFPEAVLQVWFGIDIEPDSPAPPTANQTLYAILGIKQASDATEIRSAYRRLARTWHPDICHEPDAHQMFIRILRAYEVVNNPTTRRRYDAGLLMQGSAPKERPTSSWVETMAMGYRSPLRCGLILAEGVEQLGRFVVSSIMAWADIVGPTGLILSTSWPAGATTFEEAWVMP